METEFPVVDSTEMLELVSTRMQNCHCHTIPVAHRDRLVGLMTMDNLGEFLMIQAALKGEGSPKTAAPLAYPVEGRAS